MCQTDGHIAVTKAHNKNKFRGKGQPIRKNKVNVFVSFEWVGPYIYLSKTIATPPAQRVQFILGEEVETDGGAAVETHPLFSEMEELVKDGDDIEWKETARWVKFEEDVEEGPFLVCVCFFFFRK